jgi:hypothetical protein
MRFLWYHQAYLSVNSDIYLPLANSSLPWLCKVCHTPNHTSISIENPDTDNIRYTIYKTKIRENRRGNKRMDNPDTDNTGYTMYKTKVSENRRGNQE